MKKITIVVVALLLSLSAFGLTMKDLRIVRSNDIRIEFCNLTIKWAKDLRKEIEAEQKVIEELQNKGQINQTQRTDILAEYETSIQTKFQSRPTLQTVRDAYVARRNILDTEREVLDAQ